jgi:hypothetical protein
MPRSTRTPARGSSLTAASGRLIATNGINPSAASAKGRPGRVRDSRKPQFDRRLTSHARSRRSTNEQQRCGPSIATHIDKCLLLLEGGVVTRPMPLRAVKRAGRRGAGIAHSVPPGRRGRTCLAWRGGPPRPAAIVTPRRIRMWRGPGPRPGWWLRLFAAVNSLAVGVPVVEFRLRWLPRRGCLGRLVGI